MASRKNDELRERTVEGPLNYYDEQRCIGTANDKGIAARLGGSRYNITSNGEKDEIYMRHMRHNDHFVTKDGVVTNKWWDRKRKFPRDPRSPVRHCMTMLDDHPKVFEKECRRMEVQLSQIENMQNFSDFQRRRHEMRPGGSPRPNRRNLADIEPKLNATKVRAKDDYLTRIADPTTARTDVSTARSGYPDWRQVQNESAAFSKCKTANTFSQSVHSTGAGKHLIEQQVFKSRERIPDYDFSVTRKNNNYSSQNKLNRSDMYYARPRLAITNNSTKYDMITNRTHKFMYS